MQTQPSQILGRYRLLGILREGSMGTLYRAIDSTTQQAVVIKALNRELLGSTDDEAAMMGLRREARSLRELRHSNIVAMLDEGESEGCPYIVLEFVEGESLQERFDRGAVFSLARAVEILSQLLNAVEYAHERGIVHRDLTPANILLTRAEDVKLADFGIAHRAVATGHTALVHANWAHGAPAHAAPAQAASAGPEPAHIDADLILGTPGYVAPETYLTGSADARADLFAAGVVLYQMLAGRQPFTGTAAEILFKVCNESPTPPSVNGASSHCEPFDSIVLRALAREPGDRFQSAAVFREALLGVYAKVSAVTAPSRAR